MLFSAQSKVTLLSCRLACVIARTHRHCIDL